METFFGWVNRPDQVEAMLPLLRIPEIKGAAPTSKGTEEVFLYKPFREVVKADPPKGPQKIGDCVSWGWGNLCNYLQALQIYQELKTKSLLVLPAQADCTEAEFNALQSQIAAIKGQYQETATESIYALSRVEIGGQKGSYDDGSTGIWASRAVVEKGTLSRPFLDSKGLGGKYDPNRAKDWGAKGLPDNLEPDAIKHPVKTTTIIRSFEDAVTQIQNGYPVAVCSNRGFTTTRDSDGFCKASGVWNHCMLFVANRFGNRPGLCCSQSWGPMMPNGPTALDQPDNTFWVDASVVDYMLKQADSYTGSNFTEYVDQDFTDWSH